MGHTGRSGYLDAKSSLPTARPSSTAPWNSWPTSSTARWVIRLARGDRAADDGVGGGVRREG
ncbi:MAG: hypothetical protein R2851_08680 [Caldilineaceae bacterium]